MEAFLSFLVFPMVITIPVIRANRAGGPRKIGNVSEQMEININKQEQSRVVVVVGVRKVVGMVSRRDSTSTTTRCSNISNSYSSASASKGMWCLYLQKDI